MVFVYCPIPTYALSVLRNHDDPTEETDLF